MIFSSLTFLLYFLPITLAGYYLLPGRAKNNWLLLVSLVFYGWGAHEFLLVMLLSVGVNYLLARAIDAAQSALWRRLLLVATVAFNLGILFYNKYMNFTTYLLNRYVSSAVAVTEILLPIGISFFTFQAMSYVIDVYRRDTPVQKNLLSLGLYISFFPQLVAGPIVRYRTVADQIDHRQVTLDRFTQGISRFLSGFAMKVLLSNAFSVVADEAFQICKENPATLSAGFAWIGAIAYSLQIYFDFCGYSSMAIGLGRLFGFEFLENFNYPYIAATVSDFWRRWHISLSQFFRDYVYIPLGGSRVSSKWLLVRNLFVVWLLTGIWHGANFTFLFWGLWYFVLLCFEWLTGIRSRPLPPLAALAYRGFTLVCVMLGWVLFRAESLGQAADYILAMFHLLGNPFRDNRMLLYLNDYKLLFLAGFLCATPVFPWLRSQLEQRFRLGRAVDLGYDLALVGCLVLGISYLVMGGNNPFIYFNF